MLVADENIVGLRGFLVLAAAATIGWLALMSFGIGGDYGYLLPVGLAGTIVIASILIGAAARRPAALSLLLIVTLTVLNYRVRGVPENPNDGREWQNTVKVLVWCCMVVPCLVNWRTLVPYGRDPRIGLLAVFVALSIASVAWSVDPAMSGVSAAGILVYLLFGCLAADVFPARDLVLTMVWSLAGYCVVNWAWTAVDPEVGLLDTGGIGSLLRLQGISGHPNLLGAHAAIMVCLLIGAYSRSYIGRVRFAVLLGLGVITMVATQSRTASLSLILGFVACRYRRLFFVAALVCAGFLTIIAMTGYLNEVKSLLVRQGDGDVLAGRGDIWDYIGPKMAERPLLGHGFNVFEKYFEFDHPNILNPTSPLAGAPIPSHPHNTYLEVLFSGGIITLLPFLAGIVLMIWRWLLEPDLLRDLFVMSLIFGSMTEVDLSGPPTLTTLVCFILLGIDHVSRREAVNGGLVISDAH